LLSQGKSTNIHSNLILASHMD